MFALSIDTAANLCSVAISSTGNGEILSSRSHDIGRGHAEILIETISSCMGDAKISYRDFDRLICTIGPGSFAGVRIGLSTARAMALALSKPLIGVSTLHACARYGQVANPQNDRETVAILSARKDEIYVQQFRDNNPLSQATVLSIEEFLKSSKPSHLQNVMICGSGVGAVLNKAEEKSLDINPVIAHQDRASPIEIIATIGLEASLSGKGDRAEPLYLRSVDAKPQHNFAVKIARDADFQNCDNVS